MTLQQFYKVFDRQINHAIIAALEEDKINNDVTTSILFDKKKSSKRINANLICKEDCVLAGIKIFIKVFRLIYPGIIIIEKYQEGTYIKKGSIVMVLQAPVCYLLEGERTALNFLQRMSGVATLTNKFVNMLKYKDSKILHTRKTTPNFRFFELAAVKIGGGDFHRFDLSSSIMIKDNHIKSFEGMKQILKKITTIKIPAILKHKFEVEVKSLNEIKFLLDNQFNLVKIVMLDNFKKIDIQESINLLKKHGIKIELSGGINLKNFIGLQYKGIDYYSIGMITHGYKSIDFALDF